MVVVSVVEKAESKDGRDRIVGEEPNIDIVFEYKRTLVVVVSSIHDDENTVLMDPRVPRLGTELALGQSRDNRAFCKSRAPSQTSVKSWEVDLVYGSVDGDPKEDDDPLKKPPTVVWGSQMRLWYPPDFLDADGKRIENSAGDPFIPTIPRERSDLTLTIGRAELGIQVRQIHIALGKINSLRWAGFAPELVKFSQYGATKQWHQGRFHWNVTYSFIVRAEKWGVKVLDEGKRFRLAEGARAGELVAATDANGVITGEKVKLINGNRLPDRAEFQPQYLNFQMHEKADFTALNFPWWNN